jgi:Tol biopolymer transport system component
MFRRVTGVVFALVVTAVAATAAAAPTSGPNGLIAYAQEVRGRYQLFTIRPDGTENTQVTHLKGTAFGPDWSPDGKLIAFTYETPRANGSVALISARGTGFREVTPAAPEPRPKHVWNGNPAFTPDGKSIVFVRNQGPADSGIWIMRTDGSGLRRLTRNPYVRNWDGGDVAPTVSPDGRRIAFVRIKKAETLQALFVVRTDGTGLRQVTPYSLEVAIKVDWSSDGRLIVLTTNADWVRPHKSANLVVIRPDGSGQTQLTRFAGRKQNAFAGSFSPDGKRIVFRLEQGSRYALAVIDRNGHNLRLLTRLSEAKPRAIDWGTAR